MKLDPELAFSLVILIIAGVILYFGFRKDG